MSAERPPLNGEKTHPLTAHAIGVLRSLAKAPVRSYLINPGVFNRLAREDLAEIRSVHGIRFVEITAAGRAALAGDRS